MSLYLLRHCEREKSPQFYTPLTTYGKGEAHRLTEEIRKINVEMIYASPFLRTIQTIEPYCRKYSMKVNIENALYECIREPFFDKDNYKFGINELLKEKSNLKDIINTDYVSTVNLDDISCSDDLSLMYNRFIPFLEYIKGEVMSGKICLLVTHRTTFNLIEGYIQYGKFINEDPPWKPLEGIIKKII